MPKRSTNYLFDIVLITGLTVIIKLLLIIYLPSLHHPDENFQLFEAAHRLSFGYGIKTWEFEDGVRSYVLPSILSLLLDVSAYLTADPQVYIVILRTCVMTFSLFAVILLHRSLKDDGRLHAFMGAFVLSTWFEIVYFSFRPLTESISTSCLICAISIGLKAKRTGQEKHLRLTGFFSALAVLFRFHIGLGAVALAFHVCGLNFRTRWLHFIAGSLIPIAVFGLCDWLTWGWPFRSFYEAFRINLLEGKSAAYGVEPYTWYFSEMGKNWGFASPLLCLLILCGIKRQMLWIVVGCLILISHMFVPHKEYRFILPAITCFIVAAALASADLVKSAQKTFGLRSAAIPGFITILVWSSTSIALANSYFYKQWSHSNELVRAFYYLSKQKDLCGLLLFNIPWWETGGYAHLHRNVPIYDQRHVTFLGQNVTQFANYVAMPAASVPNEPATYQLVECINRESPTGICILQRAGGCLESPGVPPLAKLRLGG